MKVYLIALIALLSAPFTFASSTRITLHESADLVFEKPFVVTVETDVPLHIGFTSKELDCDDACIEMGQVVKGGMDSRVGTQHGMNTRFEPINGKIVVAFHYLKPGKKAVSIYREEQVCDSQACSLLKRHNIAYPYEFDKVDLKWKQVTIKTISSIEPSTDGSYTRVIGETVFGGKFDINLIAWLIDHNRFSGSCARYIEKRKNAFTETGKGYSFSGSFLSHSATGETTPIMVDVGCGNWDYDEKKENFL
ncbi:hypothetical protein [Microbulbifer sp. SSSA005]|uniref:hypothetical protein n=1 Tax=Microbulbifer sp. SSSA005 TaxID=3243378 RepID=UPI00403A564D